MTTQPSNHKRPTLSFQYTRTTILCLLLAISMVAGAMPAQGATTASPDQARAGQPISVRWGFYITYNPNSWVSLQANAQYLNYVSPWFFNLGADGRITGRDRPEVSALLGQ